MFESSITIKGQTTLPKAVRDALAVKAGDKVRYVIVDEGVLIIPVRPTSRLFRSLKYDGPAVSLEEMDKAAAEGAIKRLIGLNVEVPPDPDTLSRELEAAHDPGGLH